MSQKNCLGLCFLLMLLLNAQAKAGAPYLEEQSNKTRAITAANEQDIDARIDYIQNALNHASGYSRFWQQGWMSGISLLTTRDIYLATRSGDPNKRYDTKISATLGVISVYQGLRSPMLAHLYAPQLSALPSDNYQQKLFKLERAEDMLAKAAFREHYERSWPNRLQTYLAGAAVYSLIAYGDDRPKDARINLTITIIGSEIKMLSSPRAMGRAKNAYDQGRYHTLQKENARKSPFLSFGVNPRQGVELTYHF